MCEGQRTLQTWQGPIKILAAFLTYIWTLRDFAGWCVEKLLPLQMSFKEQFTQKWRFCHHLLMTDFLSSVGHKRRFAKSFKPQPTARGCPAPKSTKKYHKITTQIVHLTCVPYLKYSFVWLRNKTNVIRQMISNFIDCCMCCTVLYMCVNMQNCERELNIFSELEKKYLKKLLYLLFSLRNF